MTALIETVDLTLKVADRLLVDSLTWQVEPGQCWCVIGRNGAGKSTLLRTLAGLRDANGGQIRIEGSEPGMRSLQALARTRAFLPQGRIDAFGYSAIEMVLTARYPYHDSAYWESFADHAAALAALQMMDAGDLATRDVRSLSGGERQRVAIAATLAQDTALLLLDEPTAALDLAHQVSVMHVFAKLCKDSMKSIVMVTHDLNLAHRAATHALLLMGDGHWRAGTVGEVMQAPLLGECLGHPIEIARHGTRTIYLPEGIS